MFTKLPNKLAPLMALAAIGLFGHLISSAPIYLKNYWSKSKGLNGTEIKIVQKCLYYGPNGNRCSLGDNFPRAFCARLYRPDSDAPEDRNLSTLTPREQVMRQFFYLEAAQLWSYYLDFDACYLRRGDNVTERCPFESIPPYEGVFARDFRSNRYELKERMAAVVQQYQPTARRLEHCLHLHQHYPPEPFFFQVSELYGPCEQWTNASWSKVGGAEMPAGVWRHLMGWKSRSDRRHRLLFAINFNASYAVGKVKWSFSWDGVETFLYNGLYTRLNSSFGGPKLAARKTVLMKELQGDWFATPGMKRRPWLTILREHLQANVYIDQFYDCLKFHRHETAPWCKGVTWVKNVTDGKVIQLYCPGEAVHDGFLGIVSQLVEVERRRDRALLVDVAERQMPFLILPETIVDYCHRRMAQAKEDQAIGELDENPDEDCREGGLYNNFFL